MRTGRNYIAMSNGIVDLDGLIAGKDDILIPHTPKWFSPICLPYRFDPEAECPIWSRTLEENLEGDVERISLLQEWAGYLLTPDTGQQKFLILEGEGANGKSVYCAGIEAMLGSDSVAHIPLEMFGVRFVLTDTLGKLANIAADCGEIDKVAEGYLKTFTSGDKMFFDRKGKPGFSARPTARLMVATNNRPRFSDRSSGLWRRMILGPFRIEIPRNKRIVGMDKSEWWEGRGELSGVFNWAVAGLARLREQGDFTESSLCRESIDEYRIEVNPARNFLLECCEFNSMATTSSQELYATYKKWCGMNGYHPLGEKQFGREIRRIFPQAQRKRSGVGKIRPWYYSGILLNDDF